MLRYVTEKCPADYNINEHYESGGKIPSSKRGNTNTRTPSMRIVEKRLGVDVDSCGVGVCNAHLTMGS